VDGKAGRERKDKIHDMGWIDSMFNGRQCNKKRWWYDDTDAMVVVGLVDFFDRITTFQEDQVVYF